MKIVIPDYRMKSRNQTAKKHYRYYMRARDEIVQMIMGYLDELERYKKATVTIKAYYKGKRCVDTSNIDDKLVLDGLQIVGILEDDTPYENPKIIKEAYPESGENKVIINIEEVKNE